ncbi:MAG TPA: serine/threonine-protein kinase [Polyangiaceae bacterium]
MTSPSTACAQCGAPLAPDQRICGACRALQPARESFSRGVTIERGDGRLVVDSRIGEGGMGVVWRAWLFHPPGSPQGEAPEPVALKVLRAPGVQREAVRVLFLREAEALRRLSHPNIVGFLDLFEHAGSLVLAIEYVDGDTLETVIARHVARARLAGSSGLPGMPLLRAWFYFQQLLGALAAVHALGIVHRDVKPSNVLVRRDGIVKLSDFGIVRFADAPSSAATSQLSLGTGAYMSPEQVLSKSPDARSDLYSAATVLYEMLAGRTPFGDDRSEFLIRKDQVETPAPPIRVFLPQAPPVLDALFARALAKNPAQRFTSAIELGDAFRRALGLPETTEWQAQAEFAQAARTMADTPYPDASAGPVGTETESQHKRLATLREFVISGYKTKPLASV